MPEQSPAASRRATLLVGLVAAVALVVVAVVVLRSEGPDNSTESHPPASPSRVLSHSSGLVDQSIATFRDHHDQAWPASLWTEGRNLKMTGPGASEVYSPGVDKGVQVTWYRTKGDRFAYCLTNDLRHLWVVTTSTEVKKRETTGACPAPSLDPAD